MIDFTSKFCENPNPERKNEFPMDLELSDKLERYSEVFLSMLIQRHKEINPAKITEPREVINATNNYKENNDVIGQFINDNLVKDVDNKEGMKLMELFNEYRIWANKDNALKNKKIDRNQFRSYLEQIYGTYNQNKGWIGIRLKTDEEKK